MEIWNLLNSMVSKYKATPWLSEQNLGIEIKVLKNSFCQWFALDYSIQQFSHVDPEITEFIILTSNLQNLVFNKN